VDKSVEIISSRTNPICVRFKKLGSDKTYRYECGEFLCAGEKLLKEAVESSIKINTVLTSKSINIELPGDIRLIKIKEDLIDYISPLKKSSGPLFTCQMLQINKIYDPIGTYILLDNIQDPGNVGTILRTACAFEISGVILTEGCADIYNPKTVRASMGSIFKQNINLMTNDEIIDLKTSGLKIYGAINNDSSVNIDQIDFNRSVIIIGNEGQGISDQLLSHCDMHVKIPISKKCESLNAATAASIIIWEASKAKGEKDGIC